ncbi:MAG TPA: glycosyltransferase [Patescibacteria group bacterium]|nr:glycosyltransferase [Patescibacteria group bacterium]
MLAVFWVFGASIIIELLAQFIPLLWRFRKLMASFALLLVTFSAGAIVIFRPSLFSAIIAVICLYRAFNDIRVVEGRMHEGYLHQATRRTTIILIFLQILTALAWWAWHTWHQDGHLVWSVVAGLQLLAAIVLLISTIRSLKHTAWPARARTHYKDGELPTLTVAIPARNETDDLQFCLESLVASDYPKMEIIVLDDRSQTRRTPDIIRSFAHDGVRFVLGEEPKETWLPKNQAYDRLLGEASGEMIIFCGVDIRFAPGTLRKIVSEMLVKNKTVMSILPERAPMARSRFALAQAMRYFWELAPPRRQLQRPPVLSSCWAAKSEMLRKAGGFAAVARSIVPEAHFARMAAKTDSYSFMRAGKTLQLTSVKEARDQRDTAIRTRYPQLHRRPENVFVVSCLEVVFWIMPFALAIAGYWLGIGLLAVLLAAITSLLLIVGYEMITSATYISSRSFGIIALPIVVLFDLGMLHYSMWQYELSVVEWKGRNVTLPAMHVIPHLPEIK